MKLIPSAILSISVVLLLASVGTWAEYSDTESSTGNELTSGIMDLALTDTTTSADYQWIISKGYPGGAPERGDIRIFNLGTVEANHVEITFHTVGHEDDDGDQANGYKAGPESDTDINSVGGMAKSIMVNTMDYTVVRQPTLHLVWNTYDPLTKKYTAHYDSRLEDLNYNGVIDLEDLSKTTIDNLPAPIAINKDKPDGDHYAQFDMELSIYDNHEDQNDFQGDIIDMDVEVTLNQDASQ